MLLLIIINYYNRYQLLLITINYYNRIIVVNVQIFEEEQGFGVFYKHWFIS